MSLTITTSYGTHRFPSPPHPGLAPGLLSNKCSIQSKLLWGSTTRTCRGGSWKQRSLIDRLTVRRPSRGRDGRAPGSPAWNAGGDGPAWSRKRQPYRGHRPILDQTRPLMLPDSPAVPYAELHCHTNFSFLDGASHPEQLAEEAARLGLEALAVTDHDGLYGVVRFAEAARAVGLPTVFGAEITLCTSYQPERSSPKSRPSSRSPPAVVPDSSCSRSARRPSAGAR